MTDTMNEIMKVIDESSDPEKVAEYVLNLFLDYLRISSQAQESVSACPRE